MRYFRTTTYILAICLLYQALCGNEGSKWIKADLIDLKDASTQNDSYAQGFLALSYMHGDKGLDLSMDKALELSKAAAGQNHWLGHFALGYLARFEPYGPNESIVRKHYLEAFQDPDARLIKAFTNNDPVASYALGEIFTSDEVRPDLVPDFTFAAKHYEKSSQGGYQPASVQYALFKQHEIVDPEMAIEKDLVQGINLLKRAAQSKLPAAYHYLGRSYFKGIGVELDQEMALVNFRAAADRGFTISQLAVAEFFAYGVAGPPKIDLAIRYARLALDQEEEHAMAKIAEYEELLLGDSPVLQPTPVPAISAPPPPMAPPPPPIDAPFPEPPAFSSTRLPSVYESSAPPPMAPPLPPPNDAVAFSGAELPSSSKEITSPVRTLSSVGVSSLREEGKKHYWGRGVSVNFESARGLFLQASDQGDGEAARYLGLMSLRGKGVAKSSEDAMKWFTLAAVRGDSLAKKNLQMLGKLY